MTMILAAPFIQAYGGANGAVLMPSIQLAAFGGGNGAVLMPSAQLTATGQNRTGQNALTYTMSMPTLSARGGANGAVTLPLNTLAITGTFWGLGRADLKMPKGFISATGRVATGGSAALEMPLFSLVGYAGAVCSITLDDGLTIAATGSSGAVGRASLTLPLFNLTASGSRQNSGSAALIMPNLRMGATARAWLMAPSMQLTAVGTAVVAVTYEAYAVNLLKSADRMPSDKSPVNEVTRYTNYPFDRIVRYKNSYFGMNATGLYLLEGTTDNGAPISYAVRTHTTDFNETAMKTVVSSYFGGSLGAAETITLYGGKTGANAYSYTTPRGTDPQNYRQKFGKGIKERYYALGVAGSDEFELSSIELEINTLARSI